ncbi:GDSL-type esterase/lipase family protein [Nonomuraea sp. NPDC049784]|uniref:SGNH/GDSL hydrolase family protein n=1 Tax=Nonomuraea sp. NPDC049784 TaxID=3154361 RepID=UPI0033C979D9
MTFWTEMLSRETPITWLFTGDSVTAGVRHLHGHRDYTQLFAERIRWELRRDRDVIVNTAVGGSTIDDVAGDLEHRVLRFRPDVVVVGVGFNDTRNEAAGVEPFRARYQEVVDRCGEPVFVAQTPNGSMPTASAHVLPHLPAYTTVIREIAAERGLTLVDHAAVWREAAERGIMEAWISQGCHPNLYGHRAMAHTLLRSLDLFADDSVVCRLAVP